MGPDLRENYFDNAATTPIDPHVVEAMLPWLNEGWGNAHSIHEPGRRAMAAADRAREQVASLLGCDPQEVFFTSGATESNNWVLRGFELGSVSPVEHSSILEPARALGHGVFGMLGGRPASPIGDVGDFISQMFVNNEIGSVYEPPPRQEGPGPLFHSDITQAVGKLAIPIDMLDLASFSAHKFYGPKGIGGLFARGGDPPKPLLSGGEHEQGFRAGTLNVPAIVGMGEAAAIAGDRLLDDLAHAEKVRGIVLEELRDVPDLRINGGEPVSPYVLSLSFVGLEGETLVIELDAQGFAISSGAACSSRSTEPSHVLTALGIEPEWLRGTIRISFGRYNTKESLKPWGKL